jgi:16S rRNA (cytosine1402-N4)-methyltransferase
MMALRIYVNGELEELDALLEALPQLLAPGGRAAVITYHSLEARRVKETWRRQDGEGLMQSAKPAVVRPSDEEIRSNPRARSAQLRSARRPSQ